jgi:histidyl-tRNA synthetase
MNDILPAQMGSWLRFEATYRRIAGLYGYQEVRTPVLEPTALFERSIGEATDIVQKEMYTFVDKGEKSLTLRPEGTASAVRAYLEHGMSSLEPVTKWFYLGPMYRRERPAKGRYRQFYQAGAESLGDASPFADAELIIMLVAFLKELGIADIEVVINSIGDVDARNRYQAALLTYLAPHRGRLSVDSQRRLDTNPLRILDSKDPSDHAITQDAPILGDYLAADDREHFDQVLTTLQSAGLGVRVNPKLVRGLDYYTRTLFEIVSLSADLGAQNALCGGGRYDGLVQMLGGPSTPAVGFAIGIERVLLAMPSHTPEPSTDVWVMTTGKELLPHAFSLVQALRAQGLRVQADWRGQSLKSQMRRADKVGARYAVILGESEAAQQQVQLKDLREHTQTEVGLPELAARLKSLLVEAQ